MAHPYRNMIGWASEIERLRAKDADKFFHKYYVPGNITIAIVGDVTAAEMKRLAEKYYASIPAGPQPPPVSIVEPVQEGPKLAELETDSQPVTMIAFKRPNQTHKDDPVFDVVQTVLASGRTGLLYKTLVRDRKIALEADAAPNIPGGKYPNLFLLFSAPTTGHTNEENEKAIYEVIDDLKKNTVDEATLARVKTKLRAGLIHQLDSNSGLATQLAFYHVAYGNWRVMFTGLDDINKVTAADVQRVVRQYFTERNRTRAHTIPLKTPATAQKETAQ